MQNRTRSSSSLRMALPAIITAARAGSLAYAWDLFRSGGYDARTDDAAALAVKGRLLKDEALRAAPADRSAAFAAAAQAYAAAEALVSQPYTRINVATLTLLGGNRRDARDIARSLLNQLDGETPFPETPYHLAAARAEALLLSDDVAGAQVALAAAIGHDPEGWPDHASTLRQLRLILDANSAPTAWLDAFRPPRSLHFAGHLGVGDDVAMIRQIATLLAREQIGFGYGALAAGADIVVAEALLAAGAELHVVLPTGVDTFVAQSVEPYGAGWRARFDACLDVAVSLRSLTGVTGGYEPLASLLAADVAMGSAALNAHQLDSEAVQILIIDDGDGEYGTGAYTARDGRRWAVTGGRQHLLRTPRVNGTVASGHRTSPEGRPDRQLAAMLHLSIDGIDDLDEGAFAGIVDRVFAPLREGLRSLDLQPTITMPAGNARIVAFETPEAAWSWAEAALRVPIDGEVLRIAGHYALAHWLHSPSALVGRGIAELEDIAAVAMPGVVTVSETMVSALFVTQTHAVRAEWVGEVGDIRLFALATADGARSPQ